MISHQTRSRFEQISFRIDDYSAAVNSSSVVQVVIGAKLGWFAIEKFPRTPSLQNVRKIPSILGKFHA